MLRNWLENRWAALREWIHANRNPIKLLLGNALVLKIIFLFVDMPDMCRNCPVTAEVTPLHLFLYAEAGVVNWVCVTWMCLIRLDKKYEEGRL